MEVNKPFYTLPHQRSSSTATTAQHSRAAMKRQSVPGHVDDNTEILEPLLTSDLLMSTKPTVTRQDDIHSGTLPHQRSSATATTAQHSRAAMKRQSVPGHVDDNTEILEPLLTDLLMSTKPTVTRQDDIHSGTLPHQRSSATATTAQHSRAAMKRQSVPGHVDDNTEILEPLLTSDLLMSTKPTVTRQDDIHSGTLPHQASLSSVEVFQSSEVTKKKQPYLVENAENVEPFLMSDLSVYPQETRGGGRSFYTLPLQTSSSAAATTLAPPGTTAKRQSVPTGMHETPEQLESLLIPASLIQQKVCPGGERLHEVPFDRTSFPYTTTFQPPEATSPDRYHAVGQALSSNKPLLTSSSPPTPLQQPYDSEGNRTFGTLPHEATKSSTTARRYSATMLEKHSPPSHRTNIYKSLEPGLTPSTSAKQTFDLENASATTLPYQIASSSSLSPTALQYLRTTTDSLPSTSAAVKNSEPLEPFFTTRSSLSGSERFSENISRQTSASYATSLHHLASETHPSPTHTAELMLAGGLPKNRRRPGASAESQHVTMRGTITRGNSVGQPVKVELDLTETEFRRLTSQEPQIKEDFGCGCGRGHGPHIILWSLLCIPVAIVISLSVAFYNGSMAWYNLIIYFSEERTVFHKVALCPLIILTFPLTVGVSALLISLVAAAMQISWSWRRWLAEIHDGEKGFYGWFCGQIGLSRCSPYQVVVLDGSSV